MSHLRQGLAKTTSPYTHRDKRKSNIVRRSINRCFFSKKWDDMSKTRRKEAQMKQPIKKQTIECACGNRIKNVHSIVCKECEKVR